VSDSSPSDAIDEPLPDAAPRDADAPAPLTDAQVPGSLSCKSLEDCVPPQGCVALENEGHIYFFCSESVPWQTARERCIAARTDLAIVESESENGFVSGNLAATSWIGLSDVDVEGDYRWIDPLGGDRAGSSASFTKWANTKPDNCGAGLFGEQDCVRVASDGSWDDSDCKGGCTEGTFTFVCESF